MADSADIVDLILAKPFESLPYEEKLRIKQQGRSTPKIDLVQKIGKSNRSFQLSWNDKVSWLTGSGVTKKCTAGHVSWWNHLTDRVTEHFLEKERRAKFTYK